MTTASPHRPQKHRHLGQRELLVLGVLVSRAGRVVGRGELVVLAGLSGLNSRRCDSIMVAVRRELPPGAIRTVRKRGWLLDRSAVPEAIALLAAN